jgi:hypothetical protein
MSAHISIIDPGTRIVWIGYVGQDGALESDLDSHCIKWIRTSSSWYKGGLHGRIGISFRPKMNEHETSRFAEASMRIVATLTSWKNPTLDKSKQFALDLAFIQTYQKELVSQGDTL